MHRFKIPKLKMHENAWNVKIKTKRRVKGSYRNVERETLQKKWSKTTKNWGEAKSELERERKLRKLLKKCFWKSQNPFLKNLIHNIRLIKKQFQLIENLEKCFFEKITWFLKTHLKALNIRNKNVWEWDEILFQNSSFKPSFPKIKIFNHSPFKNSTTKYVLPNNTQSNFKLG